MKRRKNEAKTSTDRAIDGANRAYIAERSAAFARARAYAEACYADDEPTLTHEGRESYEATIEHLEVLTRRSR